MKCHKDSVWTSIYMLDEVRTVGYCWLNVLALKNLGLLRGGFQGEGVP